MKKYYLILIAKNSANYPYFKNCGNFANFVPEMEKLPLSGMSSAQLREVAASVGLRPFAAKQMEMRLYKQRVKSLDEMTELPKAARQKLAEHYDIGVYPPTLQKESNDGTIKYLFKVVGSTEHPYYIESVFIPDKDRATLCISCQAGCRMGCKFCMTGQQGWHGNLTASEILNQILSVPESEKLTNVVFMGMGEPTDNVDAILAVIGILTEKMGWSPKRITVSSVGNIPNLKRLLDETKVHIAISVHSPFSQERAESMPIEKAFPIADVFKLLRNYDFAHQRRLSAEYIMWKGVNDNLRHADALARLLKGTDSRVNLIRYHASPDSPDKPSDKTAMERFRDRLNAQGITATIRASRGEDIEAACGMLSGKHNQ